MNTSRLPQTLLPALLAAAALSPLAASAAEADGPWLVRLRAVHLDSANKDSTGLGLSIDNKTLPDLDLSYFFTPAFAAELVLTYPQRQEVRSNGVHIGSLKHLPPTLTLQYHVTTLGAFKPYVGAGVNYTRFSRVQFDPAVQAALAPSMERHSVGLALQAGVDYEFSPGWYANVDVKKLQIRSDVRSFGTTVGTFKVDPWLVGVGVGRRF